MLVAPFGYPNRQVGHLHMPTLRNPLRIIILENGRMGIDHALGVGSRTGEVEMNKATRDSAPAYKLVDLICSRAWIS